MLILELPHHVDPGQLAERICAKASEIDAADIWVDRGSLTHSDNVVPCPVQNASSIVAISPCSVHVNEKKNSESSLQAHWKVRAIDNWTLWCLSVTSYTPLQERMKNLFNPSGHSSVHLQSMLKVYDTSHEHTSSTVAVPGTLCNKVAMAVAVDAQTSYAEVRVIRRRGRPLGGFRNVDVLWTVVHVLLLSVAMQSIGEPRLRAQELKEQRIADLKATLADEELHREYLIELEKFEQGVSRLTRRPATLEELEESLLPPSFLPEFLPLVMCAASALGHIVFLLSLRWMAQWKAMVDYENVDTLDTGTSVLVVPFPHKGKTQIVPLNRYSDEIYNDDFINRQLCKSDTISSRAYFVVDGTRWELTDSEAASVREVPFPVSLPVSWYFSDQGIANDAAAARVRARFGSNSLARPQPSFLETFINQILGPVPCFQMFCCSLWLLDAYWWYALFSFGMIAMLEASTAFQRVRSIKNLQTMQSSGSAPTSDDNVFVYRAGQWQMVPKADLVPGDIFSIAPPDAPAISDSPDDEDEEDIPPPTKSIPCDAVIVAGSVIVNEASLTGESTPQLKEPLTGAEVDTLLDIESRHKSCFLHSGTILLQSSPGIFGVPPPDNGVVCRCVRVGFSSSQGRLVRLLESSGENVRGDTKETLALFTILLGMASLASLQVLRAGLNDDSRSPYEVLLRCILILTSVVPPELPMQAAAAVHAALLSLHRDKVFCTEPHRVPLAGGISITLFDKTGTITTDQLTAVGCISADNVFASEYEPTPIPECDVHIRTVLGGCHSLVATGKNNKNITGDPIETAAFNTLQWKYDADNHTIHPDDSFPVSSMRIEHRYHFSSTLQRMSVIVSVQSNGQKRRQTHLLSKGSPEAILPLLADSASSDFSAIYTRAYESLTARGMRVLALATRELDSLEVLARKEAESNLRFVGFAAFACLSRRDSALVVSQLKEGGMPVIMVTGDAPMTALHVARSCGLSASSKLPALQLAADGTSWIPINDGYGDDIESVPFSVGDVQELAQSRALVVTGVALDECLSTNCGGSDAHTDAQSRFWSPIAEYVSVYARMTPSHKELLVRALRVKGHSVFMCGDGANDVGALRAADVGLALLSGFGVANTAKAGDKQAHEMTAEETKEYEREKLRKRKEKAKKVAEQRKADSAKAKEMQQKFFAEEMKKAEDSGESFGAIKATGRAAQRLIQWQRARLDKRRRSGRVGFGAEAASLAEEMGGLDSDLGGAPVVQLGDASVAAPFTSKLPSIKSAVDIIRQGRCTLASTIQNQQILVLTCLISAYSLSVLYIDNVRMAEAQMMVTGILLSIASIAFSFARPVEKLSPVRPLRSIFHPATVASTVMQVLISLACLAMAVSLCKSYTDEHGPIVEPYPRPDWLQEVIDQMATILGEEDETTSSSLTRPFRPSLLNTVVFLVETAQQISVILVNYRGRPFMRAATENVPMLLSLSACIAIVIATTTEYFPELNGGMRLVPLPSDEFRTSLLLILMLSLVGSLIADRICALIFSPQLAWIGYVEAFRALPTPKQFLITLAKWTVATVVGGYIILSGNLILGIIGYFLYRKFIAKPAEV